MRLPKAVFALAFLGLALGAANCGGSTDSTPGTTSTGADGGGVETHDSGGGGGSGDDSGTYVPPTTTPPAACDASASGLPETRSVAACSATRPPGLFQGQDAGTCSPSGNSCCQDSDCTAGKNGRCTNGRQISHICTYDACTTDADCGSGLVCNCEGNGNRCIPANCKSDADCGSGFTCAATYDQVCGAYDGIAGYYCHSAKDDCKSQCDCDCTFSSTASKWICPTTNVTCSG